MQSIRRSCQLALQNPRYACIYANGSRRAFSQSSAHSRGALPNFLPPSSPELSTLLSTFNSKVLLPYHLTKEQQKLVYSEESRPKLEAEPVEITLGDVTLPLEHLDRNKLPDRWQTLRRVVEKSETQEDWENVLRCLEGFVEAGIRAKAQWQEMIIRKLALADMHHLILKALQRPKATEIRLSNRGVLTQVLRGVHSRAAIVDWDQEETTKALKMAKQVVELMEHKDHCGNKPATMTEKDGDWRGHPVVIALPTELAAVVAEKYRGDKEEVKRLATRLVAAIKQTDFVTSLNGLLENSSKSSADFSDVKSHLEFVTKHCHDLFELVIVWNALKTSRKVLGGDMPMANDAQQFETKVDQVLKQSLDKLDTLASCNGTVLKTQYLDMVKEAVQECS
ncbi:hypothetical protein COCMIDRAFT_35449 [Bipolaris oryzae ATCC 44560]|uniref:Uncharacterized protein n=1 Tax=Bipolaris oryzae ATCC 44560 TaxID=930090 RepID=W6ZHX1_COCMI|nr:uncharacterized protein COCMIDRAFT_35449 [Bipolaris oryzae ATCC 44560]EUC47014.1 hypothetical protein COCMIDRAFT_35449 [Bipolaris oryzae ATCC 44560]